MDTHANTHDIRKKKYVFSIQRVSSWTHVLILAIFVEKIRIQHSTCKFMDTRANTHDIRRKNRYSAFNV